MPRTHTAMHFARSTANLILRAIGCRLLERHWPDSSAAWDGHGFAAACRRCDTPIYRHAPGSWRSIRTIPAPACDPAPCCRNGPKTANATSSTSEAARLMLEAIMLLDELPHAECHASTAAAHAQMALDILLSVQAKT